MNFKKHIGKKVKITVKSGSIYFGILYFYGKEKIVLCDFGWKRKEHNFVSTSKTDKTRKFLKSEITSIVESQF